MNNEGVCYIQTQENNIVKSRARSASIFVHCFRVFGFPSETLVRVVNMVSQMNGDVTDVFLI